MLHKIYSFCKNPQSKNSSQLHLTEVVGSEEDAYQAIEELETQGNCVNGWLREWEEGEQRWVEQVSVPSEWVQGKKGKR